MNARKWPAAKVENWPLERLTAYDKNPRTHTAEQVEKVARSIDEFGWTNPVLVDEEGVIIAGHGRVLAAELRKIPKVPVMVARDWTEAQKRAYRIADNRLALDAGWDEELLRVELEDLKAADYDLDLTGLSGAEMEQLLLIPGGQGESDEEPPPEPEAVAITRPGEVWQLGEHRLMCGDSRDPQALAALMAGERAGLVHADPPYGMGKEAAGVQNDNLYGEKLDAFQLEWWKACRAHVTDNASAYIWGNAADLWRLWYRAGLGELEPLTFRNEIVWDKQSIAGMKSEDLTQYPEASERCLFFQLGRHVLLINQTKDDYWEGWEPLRTWLCEQRDAAQLGPQDVKRICGNHMYGHWFGKSQWAFINRENYEKLAAAAGGKAFARPYDELLAEYRKIADVFNGDIKGPREAEHQAVRPYFDNAHDVMRDVWTFGRVKTEERFDHPTPKPVAMMERVMRSSLREGGLCLEPFAGTGSTLIGAQRARRRCYAMELDPIWVDVTIRRWQAMTGKDALLAGTRETFARVENARQETETDIHGGA